MTKKREIYIRIQEIKKIITLLDEIKSLNGETNTLFSKYEELNKKENHLFENWNYYLEDISQKIDHVTL